MVTKFFYITIEPRASIYDNTKENIFFEIITFSFCFPKLCVFLDLINTITYKQ